MGSTNWERIVEWDIETWKRAFEFWEISVDWTQVKCALEIGARNGGPSFWLAEKGIEVDCTDRKNIEEKAEKIFKKEELKGKISFFNLNILSLKEEEKYDLILCKSVLGGVGNYGETEQIKQAIQQVYIALKPGGYFLFAENLIASPLHQYLRKKKNKWSIGWHYLKKENLREFCNPFSMVEVKTTGFLSAFGGHESRKRNLAKIDQVIIPLIPHQWHYLGYGLAKK